MTSQRRKGTRTRIKTMRSYNSLSNGHLTSRPVKQWRKDYKWPVRKPDRPSHRPNPSRNRIMENPGISPQDLGITGISIILEMWWRKPQQFPTKPYKKGGIGSDISSVWAENQESIKGKVIQYGSVRTRKSTQLGTGRRSKFTSRL